MYRNIGLRNQQAIEANGHKLLELWRKEDQLRYFYTAYKGLLEQQQILFNAANIIVNR